MNILCTTPLPNSYAFNLFTLVIMSILCTTPLPYSYAFNLQHSSCKHVF